MTFEEYRYMLLVKDWPEEVDCVIWMQSDWRTLAGLSQMLEWFSTYPKAEVLIVGDNDGTLDIAKGEMMRGGAPTVVQMFKMLVDVPLGDEALDRVHLRLDCTNTAEQAKAVQQFVAENHLQSALVLVPYYHVTRAALTFERQGVDIDLTWRPVDGTACDSDDWQEKMKIDMYELEMP
jgi:hypothetical protein